MIKIGILGATSHIAKGLICNFNRNKIYSLFLFSRRTETVNSFLSETGCLVNGNYEYDFLFEVKLDVIINCIGYGKASSVQTAGVELFSVFEKFDNLCLSYLDRFPSTLYLYFSSGAVYGTSMEEPGNSDSKACFQVNLPESKSHYQLIKLYTEAKHRAYSERKIWDIRVFNYFSRFIDLESGMLITDIVKSLITDTELKTNALDIERDFIHPDDLFQLVEKILSYNSGNGSVDLYSCSPVRKLKLLQYLSDKYGLKYTVDNEITGVNATGIKNIYYSSCKKAEDKFGYKPVYDSISSVDQVLSDFIKK